jgi:hypothetical protein
MDIDQLEAVDELDMVIPPELREHDFDKVEMETLSPTNFTVLGFEEK